MNLVPIITIATLLGIGAYLVKRISSTYRDVKKMKRDEDLKKKEIQREQKSQASEGEHRTDLIVYVQNPEKLDNEENELEYSIQADEIKIINNFSKRYHIDENKISISRDIKYSSVLDVLEDSEIDSRFVEIIQHG